MMPREDLSGRGHLSDQGPDKVNEKPSRCLGKELSEQREVQKQRPGGGRDSVFSINSTAPGWNPSRGRRMQDEAGGRASWKNWIPV